MRGLLILLLLLQTHPLMSQTYVLAVGSNQSFNKNFEQLKYAERDAERFGQTLLQHGGIDASQLTVVKSPSLATLRALFKDLELSWIQGTKKFVFYFSGHADEDSLHLVDGPLAKTEFWQMINKLRADTKVMILDGCYTGAFLNKGVSQSAAIDVPKIEFDEPSGSVYLSATSSSQVAFESDKLQSGLFTHNLIDGLNGDADINHDGVVTLWELYEFSFQRTKLASLAIPGSQIQRPEFSAKLSGSGAIAMTFPNGRSGVVELNGDIAGDLHILSENGLAEINFYKARGRSQKLVLPAGAYQITLKDKNRIGFYKADIDGKNQNLLASNDFIWANLMGDLESKGPSQTQTLNSQHTSSQGEPVSPVEYMVFAGYAGMSESPVAGGTLTFAGTVFKPGITASMTMGEEHLSRIGLFFRTSLASNHMWLETGVGTAQRPRLKTAEPDAETRPWRRDFFPEAFVRLNLIPNEVWGVFADYHSTWRSLSRATDFGEAMVGIGAKLL